MSRVVSAIFAGHILFSSTFGAGFGDGQQVGQSTGLYYRQNFNSAVTKPMTANETMKTVDGSKAFNNANVSCTNSSTAPYFNMQYSTDSDGEIVLNSHIDRNLDGSYDSNGIGWLDYLGASIPSRSISGVCMAGIVSCTPGTWNGCGYYKWTSSGGNLFLKEGLQQEVGSCQCSNSSCGSTSNMNRGTFLDILSNGAISVVSGGNANYTISRVEHAGDSITYWGQDYSNCNNNGMSYNNYGGSLEQRGQAAQYDAASDPNSATSAMVNSNRSSESGVTQKLNYFSTNSFGSPTIDDDSATKIFNRQDSIAGSATSTQTSNGYAVGYSDTYVKADGTVVTQSNAVNVQTSDMPVPKLCTVYWYAATPDVFSDQMNRSQTNATDEVKHMETRECVSDVCPVNSGEGIEKNCAEGSQEELFQMTARIQGIQEAAQDMICSTQ